MSCRVCQPCSPTDQSCITSPVVLAPCTCTETPATRAEGPPGAEGPVGDTVAFTVGSVTEGTAAVTFTVNTPTDYTVDFVIPQPPIDTANTWTAVQTYEMSAIFEQGFETTGGVVIIGGTGLTVAPNTEFSNDLTVGGDEFVTGTLRIGGGTNIAGNMSVAGAAFLYNTSITGDVSFDAAATIIVSDAATGRFPRGVLVLSDCNNPQLLPNRGSDFYQKEDATGLLTIATLTSGPLSDAFVVNIPVSSCTPQVTPVIDVTARIGYTFDNVVTGPFTARLWKGAITTGTLLDEVEVGVAALNNTPGGCIVLDGQGTFQVGNTNLLVEIQNDTDANLVPQQVTFWATNI